MLRERLKLSGNGLRFQGLRPPFQRLGAKNGCDVEKCHELANDSHAWGAGHSGSIVRIANKKRITPRHWIVVRLMIRGTWITATQGSW